MPEPVFTSDWSYTREHWPNLFAPYVGKPGLLFLEIGCFEGQSALWTLDHVLTDPTSHLDVIDPFTIERDDTDQLTRFRRNIEPYQDRVTIFRGRSQEILIDLSSTAYDCIYVDGDHRPAHVLTDAILAWVLLKPGGHLLFDDYVAELAGHPGPQWAIDAFAFCFKPEIGSHHRVGADQYLIQKPS